MRIDPLKVRMAAEVKGLGAHCKLARATRISDTVISLLYNGSEVAIKFAKPLAKALGVREVDIVSDDDEFAVNLAKLQAWRNAGCPAQPILGAVVS